MCAVTIVTDAVHADAACVVVADAAKNVSANAVAVSARYADAACVLFVL